MDNLMYFESLNYQYCELIKHGVMEKDVIARVYVNESKLNSIIAHISEYVPNRYIYKMISLYLNSKIAFKSKYYKEYYSIKTSSQIFFRNTVQICNFNVTEPSQVEGVYSEVYSNAFNISVNLFITLFRYLDTIYDRFITNNVIYNDSIVLITKTGFGIIISNIGTINNFRYREFLNDCIFTIKDNLENGEDVW